MEGIPPRGGRAGGRRGGRGAVRRGPIVDRPAWRAPLLFPPGVDNEAEEADLYEAGSDVEMEVLDQPEQAAQAGPADINALLQELAALRAAMQAGGAGQHAAVGAAVPHAGPAQQPPAAAPERFGYAPYFQNPPPFPRVVSASEMLTLRKAVPRFDGKISYEAYRASFDDLVGLYPSLTEDQRFQLLSSGLQGAPQSLLEDLGENRTFAALDEALRLSYSKPVHAWTEMNNLTTMKQDPLRVPGGVVHAEEFAVQYFIIGLNSSQIKNGVSGLSCRTLQEALNACRLVRSRLTSGPAAKKVCTASVAEATVEVVPAPAAPAPSAAAPSPSTSAGPSWQDQLAALSRQVEQVVQAVRQTTVAADAGSAPAAAVGKRTVASLVTKAITPGEAKAPLTQEAQVQPVGSPTAILKVNNMPVTVTIDTGAQITVLRRGLLPGPPAPPSKYRLRGVNDAVSVLYGPVITTLKIAGEEYRCVALESDIHDECILGMDFMRVHRAVVDTGRLKLYLDSPSKNAQVTCPFALRESSDAGKFGANSVFVVARAAVTVELQPYGSVICPAQLRGIFPVQDRVVTARVLRAQCVLESDGSMEATMDGVHTVPMVPVASCVVSPDGTRGSSTEEVTGGAALLGPEAVRPGRGSADTSDFDTTPTFALLSGDFNFQSRNSMCPNGAYEREVDRALFALTLGLVQPSPLLDQRQCALVPGFVPFAPGTMELELENQTGNHVVLPRGSVVALVHPVGFVDLQKYEPLDPDDIVAVESATVERVPPTDQADIQLEPRLPPIALGEDLPEDLQALADRCEDLTPEQKREVANVLRRNHDIFVKNNDDFEKGIGTDDAKVDKIVHWPTPRNVSELWSWIGLVGFYSRFIHRLAEIQAPLTDLLCEKTPFVWSDECQHAFDTLKTALTTAPVLGAADPSKGVFSVHCDASAKAVACILSQEQDGRPVVLHYHSKKMPRLKRALCATHAELYALVEATRVFRLYLLGRPFVFYTDHSALQWLRSFKQLEGKLARWIMRLEEFRFEIRHMKGKELTNADALSRRPERPCAPDCRSCKRLEEHNETYDDNLNFMVRSFQIECTEWDDATVSAAQQADPDIGPIYQAVLKGERPHFQQIVGYGPVTRSLWVQFNSLVIEHGVLKRRFEHASGDPMFLRKQILVPADRTTRLVLQYHTGPSSGSHFGVSKCYKLLRDRFYWPGMYTKVWDTIKCCLRCQQVKGPAEKTRAPMKVFREGTLFGRFHVDFLGPLQPSYPERYRHVMVVVEAFSAWPEAVPLRTLQAAEVANALVSQVFSRLGAPYELVTDQGSTFESALFKEVMAIYKTRKCHVSVGRPAGNGKVENYIRSLTRQIAVLAAEQPSNWPDLLPHVLHAYRASVNDTTGFSPYEVLYGRPMRVPQDLQHGVPPPGLPEVAMSQYPGVLRDRLSKIHHLVRENTHRATLRIKSHYDKFSTLTYFKPGDIVLLYNRRRRRGKTTKLYAAWEGPFKILDMLNDCIARIEEVRPENYVGRRQRKRLIVHVDRLAAIGSNLVDQNGEWIKFH
ncbi:Transposon Tf2-6 polyprotein [Frankliniella fusca]|uniref:RNA-directed DNA polymerase n=1 Tax=Frankliniella fusca TaxID=407009 RepID=A0AAE1GZ73_9NEOP|nr:Transposon Tf2-6 polyprotein [Frankliniella fusca]